MNLPPPPKFGYLPTYLLPTLPVGCCTLRPLPYTAVLLYYDTIRYSTLYLGTPKTNSCKHTPYDAELKSTKPNRIGCNDDGTGLILPVAISLGTVTVAVFKFSRPTNRPDDCHAAFERAETETRRRHFRPRAAEEGYPSTNLKEPETKRSTRILPLIQSETERRVKNTTHHGRQETDLYRARR